MSKIPKITYPVASLIVGAIFIIIAISTRIEYGKFKLILSSPWQIIGACVAGIIIICIGFIKKEIVPQKSSAKEKNKTINNNLKEDISRQVSTNIVGNKEFLFTLDDRPETNFPCIIKDAETVWVLGRTIVNLLGQYRKDFELLAKRGCDLRLLFLDPDSEASKHVYGGNPDIYKNNAHNSGLVLKSLRDKLGKSIQIRVTSYVPTFGIVFIKKRDSIEFLQAQFYFLHSRIGRDRPLFRLYPANKWYDCFFEEFVELWDNGKVWDEKKS